MKDRKNIFLLIGVVLSALPLISNIVKHLKYVRAYISILSNVSTDDLLSLMIVDTLLRMVVDVFFVVLIVILAVVYFWRNTRKCNNRMMPMIGIIASALYLSYAVFSTVADIPSAIIHQAFDLLMVRYFINTLLINFGIGILGAVILLIGYIKSLPKRNA